MVVTNEYTAKAAAVTKDQEPIKRQYLKDWTRSNSPVLVYDIEQQSTQFRSKKSIGQYVPSTIG